MFLKEKFALGIACALIAMSPVARANVLTSATATANCQGYALSVSAAGLNVGQTYTIDYSFTVTCANNAPVTVPGSITFTAASDTVTETASGTFGGSGSLTNSCQVLGSATLTSSGSTVYINVNGQGDSPAQLMCSNLSLTCPASTGQVGVPYNSAWVASGGVPPYTFSELTFPIPPGLTEAGIGSDNNLSGTPTTAGTYPIVMSVTDSVGNNTSDSCTITIGPSMPTTCVIPPSGTAIAGAPVSWNGFTAPAGSVVWINAHLDASNVPSSSTTTVDLTGVTLVVNNTTYGLPNGQVVFTPGTATPSTVVNPDGSWTTTVSPSFNSDIFFVGQAIPVDANLENGGHGNTSSTLSFSTNSSSNTMTFSWQWSAAVYTSWPGNAAANIEPVHGKYQAGAPQNPAVQADLIQGPRGGGGSNFTGSWSGTGHGICPQ